MEIRPAVPEDKEGWARGITEFHEETSGACEYVYYLDCGDGFIGIYICQNQSVYYMQFIVPTEIP